MTAYRDEQTTKLERIEARREKLNVSHEALRLAAGMSHGAYFRMRRDGRAFTRWINALHFALRSLEQRREAEARFFDGIST
jgi:hypothetical protein